FWRSFLAFACAACRHWQPVDQSQNVFSPAIRRFRTVLRVVEAASSGSQTFCATKPNGGGFIEEKMRPGAINWPITVLRWNMIVPISCLNMTPRFRDGA